jgi:hypothetical protein
VCVSFWKRVKGWRVREAAGQQRERQAKRKKTAREEDCGDLRKPLGLWALAEKKAAAAALALK